MAEVADALETLQLQLADGDIYSEKNKAQLAVLLQQEGELKCRGEELDEAWLALQEELESLVE